MVPLVSRRARGLRAVSSVVLVLQLQTSPRSRRRIGPTRAAPLGCYPTGR